MRLNALVETSRAVGEASSRLEKIGRLATLLKQTPSSELATVVSYLSGVLPQGKTGIGAAAIGAARDVPPAPENSLDIAAVDRAISQIAAYRGPGSAASRQRGLRDLFGRATREEQDFLSRLLFGELRQGALEGILVEAVSRAAAVAPARVRRAVMVAGGLAQVAEALLSRGEAALDDFGIRLMQPVQPMLADTAPDLSLALDAGPAVVEAKLDGARIQVHKAGEDVRVFSRLLNDVTAAVPEVVEAARRIPSPTAILDGEAIALRPDGTPYPFQVTMRRFGRRLDVGGAREALPIAPFFFDCLYLDGGALIDEPLSVRLRQLQSVVLPAQLVAAEITESLESAGRFAQAVLAAGHEGVMVKRLNAPYAAGRRGSAWLKVKPARTVDLMILGAEWGSGRRRGWLSNLHLGARDAERGGFVMLGKTFKGLTDEMLRWQTARLLELEVARDAYTVYVRPEQVVEVAFNDLQQSPHYPGGLALRFARVKRYRTDKSSAEVDTIQSLRALYHQTTGTEVELPGGGGTGAPEPR